MTYYRLEVSSQREPQQHFAAVAIEQLRPRSQSQFASRVSTAAVPHIARKTRLIRVPSRSTHEGMLSLTRATWTVVSV